MIADTYFGSVREGDSLIGNKGTKAIPANAIQRKVTMIVKDDMFGLEPMLVIKFVG